MELVDYAVKLRDARTSVFRNGRFGVGDIDPTSSPLRRHISDRKALAATSSAMYDLLYSHFPFYSAEKESFVIYYRRNGKRRFKYLDYAHANNCRSLIVAVNGPRVDYGETPTQDYEHDRKKTWNMLRTLTDPRYANKIVELRTCGSATL